jgi:predicted Rdx family selenoprotein
MTHLPLQGKSLSEKLHFLEGFAEEMEKVRFAPSSMGRFVLQILGVFVDFPSIDS